MLHIHIFFVAPLCTGNVSKTCADQHQRRIAIRETTDNACPTSNLLVQPFNHVVGADARPVFKRKCCMQPYSPLISTTRFQLIGLFVSISLLCLKQECTSIILSKRPSRIHRISRWQARRFSQVGPHLICLLFVLSIIASAIFRMEISGNRRLVCQKAKRTDAVNGGAAVHLDH